MSPAFKDGDALDLIGRRFKEVGEHGDVIGDDLVEALHEILINTGRSTTYTRATVANMKAVAAEYPGNSSCIAFAFISEEQAGADPDDYLTLGEDECLKDSTGKEMILVFRSHRYIDALTGEAI